MKVLLTGGTGVVGKAVVERLASAGHDVTVVGRRAGMELPKARYVQCDINDFDAFKAVTRGNDAIVHLAAIPEPLAKPGRELFRVNCLGTFNVYEAAAELGIQRVVAASSINAFGYFYGDRGFPIQYLPVNESDVGVATDAYSFSKQVMEQVGSYFWERDRISSVLLRLPGVFPHEDIQRYARTNEEGPPPMVADLLALSPKECFAEVKRMSDAYDEFRKANRWDTKSGDDWESDFDKYGERFTQDEFGLMSWRANFFTYIDEIDSAQAVEKGLTAEYTGSHPLYVNANRNSLGLPVSEVARLFGEPVPRIRPHQSPDDTIVSIDRARELIGFEPQNIAFGDVEEG